jgi:hypothetical protein
VTNGTIFVYAPLVGERPVCHPASSSGIRVIWPRAVDRCVVSKLSKLLNQEDALSVPCLRGGFYSPQACSRNAGIVRKDFIRSFLRQITVCDHRVILLRGGDAFPVVGGRCMGRGRRCKARQGHRDMTALIGEYLLPQ